MHRRHVDSPEDVEGRQNCSVFGHSDFLLYHLHTTEVASSAIVPSLYTLPYEFTSCGECIEGMATSPSGNNVLLFTHHSLCVFHSGKGRWTQAIRLVKVGVWGEGEA